MEKFFCLQNEKSVLTRDESAFIKGVLICLVVLWHNVFIASVFESAYGIFVPAHVSGFFLITFLYGYKKTNFPDFITKLSKKIIPVYLTAFIVCAVFFAIAYGAVLKNDAMRMSLEYVCAFFLGGIYVKEATGFLFFWFFPSFFCFSVWKFLLYSNVKLGMFLLILSASLILYFNVFNGNCVSFSYANGILSGLYFIFLAFLNNCVLRKYNSTALFVVCLVLFAAFSAAVLFRGVEEIPDLIRAFFAIPFFGILFYAAKNGRILYSKFGKSLVFVGQLSLYIYVSHQIIFRAFLEISKRYAPNLVSHCGGTFNTAILTYLITLLLSIAFAKIVVNVKNRASNG